MVSHAHLWDVGCIFNYKHPFKWLDKTGTFSMSELVGILLPSSLEI